MNYDTPISEVALMLGAESAQMLLFEPFDVQTQCLETVRAHLVQLESEGILLDPIALQAELDEIIAIEMVTLGRKSP